MSPRNGLLVEKLRAVLHTGHLHSGARVCRDRNSMDNYPRLTTAFVKELQDGRHFEARLS